ERTRDLLAGLAVRIVDLGRDGEDLSARPDGRPVHRTDPDGAAYVIYTSGSTGRPKGAVITHRGLVHQMAWLQEGFGFTPEDRFLQKTPFSFDASVWELYSPLLIGARLLLARPGEHLQPDRLVQAVRDGGITILQVVPSLLGALLNEPGFDECRSLRWVSCGGETLPTELVE